MSASHVQTKREIRDLLDASGLRPNKRLGQNFLIDGNLMRRLVGTAELTTTDRVLEVGGGTGGLTDLLAASGVCVTCVETDRGLAALLARRFGDTPNVSIVHGDVLDGKHTLHPEVAAFAAGLSDGDSTAGGAMRAETKLVANLPYQIATPLVMNLLVDYPLVSRLCFTVQREMAERFVAPPGSKAYGPVSVITQTLAHAETSAQLPPEAFWPRPSVQSTMMCLRRMDSPFAEQVTADDAVSPMRRFALLVRSTFDHRRKKLRSALAHAIGKPLRDEACKLIDGDRRPATLTPAEWLMLFRGLESVRDSM